MERETDPLDMCKTLYAQIMHSSGPHCLNSRSKSLKNNPKDGKLQLVLQIACKEKHP